MGYYLGDFPGGSSVVVSFNTNQSDGTPVTLGGTPQVFVYKLGASGSSTAGVSLTVDAQSLTGYHRVAIDTSADAFYATGHDYDVLIESGTVDGISVAGVAVGRFSLANRPVLQVSDKSGYQLASDGLDVIATAPLSGVASTFPQMVVQLWRRFFKRTTLTSTQLKTYADDGVTTLTTQGVSDNGSTQEQGAAE